MKKGSIIKKAKRIPAILGMDMSRIQEMLAFLSSGRVIALDMSERSLKALAVRKKGARIKIEACYEIERKDDDLAKDLDGLFKGAEDLGSGRLVIISDEVRFLSSELSLPPGHKLSEEKLLAAAAWEMEPYLDFVSRDGLFAFQLQEPRGDADTTPILISAVSQKVYAGFSELFKSFNRKLDRVYSPEAALAFACRVPTGEKTRIMIDCRRSSIRSVSLLPSGPFIFQNLPFTEGIIEDLLKETVQELSAAAGDDVEVILAGREATRDLVSRLTPEINNIRLWEPADCFAEIELSPGLAGFNPRYATLLGAALQELTFDRGDRLGPSDKVFWLKFLTGKFKKDRRLLPAFAAALFVLVLAGHYVALKRSIACHTAKIKVLQQEKRRLLLPVEKKEKLSKDLDGTERKLEYLNKDLKQRRENLLALLKGVSDLRPPDTVIAKLSQEDENNFRIEGYALKGRSAAGFCDRLAAQNFCEKAVIISLHNDDNRKNEIFSYVFIINLRLKIKE